MYKSTPITKKAGSPLYNVLVEGSKEMYDKSTKKPLALDVRTTKDVEKGTEGTADVTKQVPGEITKTATDQCKTDASGKIIDTRKSCQQLANMTDEERKAAEVKAGFREEDTVVVEKGKKATPDKTTYLDTQIMEDTTRDVLGDLETRELGRTVKKTGKDARRAMMKESRIKNKQAKLNKKNDGKEIEAGKKGYRKQERLKAKAIETKGERETFEDAFKTAQSNRKSGRKIGSSIAGEDRMRTQGQLTPDEQIAQNKIRQERDNEVERTTPKVDYKEVFANMANSLNTFKLNYPTSTSATQMRAPLKKNYFKK